MKKNVAIKGYNNAHPSPTFAITLATYVSPSTSLLGSPFRTRSASYGREFPPSIDPFSETGRARKGIEQPKSVFFVLHT